MQAKMIGFYGLPIDPWYYSRSLVRELKASKTSFGNSYLCNFHIILYPRVIWQSYH